MFGGIQDRAGDIAKYAGVWVCGCVCVRIQDPEAGRWAGTVVAVKDQHRVRPQPAGLQRGRHVGHAVVELCATPELRFRLHDRFH